MQACIICSAGLASCRRLQLTSNVRPLKLRIASYSKLVRSPFGLSTNVANAAASFPQIVAVHTSASKSGYVHVSQLGFKVGSCCSFHQPSCVKRLPALRHVPSSKFVKCTWRRRAAPRSQFIEVAASRRRPALRVVLQSSYTKDAAVVSMARNTVALQTHRRAARQRSNRSVELRANGLPPGPRYSAGVHYL